MQTEKYEIVVGIVIVMIVLLIAVGFIVALVNYSNKRKRIFLLEKDHLRAQFSEQLLLARLEIQEESFNAISQEIHDSVGQNLSLAKIQLNILEQRDSTNDTLIKDLKESLSRAMIDLRDIAKSLSADRIKFSTLVDLTEYEIDRIRRLELFELNYKIKGEVVNVNDRTKFIVFRILQETLQNAIKHSRATKVNVVFSYGVDDLKIEVNDNGIGFDKTNLNANSGLGLQNIINRSAVIGGTGSISSSVNGGTSIFLTIPYE